jgi:putative protease
MSKNQEKRKPELLAPAGSPEAFFAAMENGADAVYAGLDEFSARAKAKNFSLRQMERITAYAHSLGRKVYVTLNTLVKEQELPHLIDVLSSLSGMRTDGVIIQDMGVYRLISEYFPEIPLHASTQMTIHNSPGVLQLDEMGFKRVVLARELHIDEIRAIVASTKMEIECFIHGALCFSFSGQCYFSSFLGGHSGNRGRCAQPCRRLYRYRGKEGYYFSPNDFSSIDMLPELVGAGVSSFKIEGRMKSAEYVAGVVGAYRMALDAAPDRRADAVAEAKEMLKLSFGRVPTKGFLASRNPTDIATPALSGATGRYLGEIQAVRGKRITFSVRDRIHVGDRIRVQPKSDKSGRAFTVKELFVANQQVKAAREKSIVVTIAPFDFKTGDLVFKVSSGTAFTMSENACLRKLESAKHDRIPCDLFISAEGENMIVTARVEGGEHVFTFKLGKLEQARSDNMESILRGQFDRTGETPFTLNSLVAPGFPALFIPAAVLKDIRRKFYRQLEEIVEKEIRQRHREARVLALAGLAGEVRSGKRQNLELAVRAESVRDFHFLTQDGVDALSLPVSRANLHQIHLFARKLRGRETQVLWRLPFIIFDADVPFYREAVETIINLGFHRFELANLSHFQLVKGKKVDLSADYRLFSLNSQAIMAWKDLGVEAVTLYIEDDAENMDALLHRDVPVLKRVMMYCEVPAITSKIRIKDMRGDSPVVSDRGDEYMIRNQEGLTLVTPSRRFSLTAHKWRIQEMGCTSFIVDISREPRERWKQVMTAFVRGEPLPDTSEFNFTTGLM